MDYIFRVLGVEYLRRYNLAHVPPEAARIEDPTETKSHDPRTLPPKSHIPDPQENLFAGRTLAEGAGSALSQHLEEMMGRRACVRQLRAYHRPQRRLLQVPQLRKFDRLLLNGVDCRRQVNLALPFGLVAESLPRIRRLSSVIREGGCPCAEQY